MALKTRYTNVGGQVVAVKTGGQRYFVEPDALGNVRGLVNQSGVRSQTYTYWPYGEVRTSTGSVAQPLQFCGTWGYYTESSTKQYVRARYYMQSIGRWQTVDLLWPNEMAYGYVRSQATTSVDPSGKEPADVASGITQCGKWVLEHHAGDLFPADPAWSPCDSVPKGGCPNQQSNYRINFSGFDKSGNDYDIDRCDPGKVDRGAIESRIRELKEMLRSGTFAGFSKNTQWWARTFPYSYNSGGKKARGCRINCPGTQALKTLILKDEQIRWKNRNTHSGIGCIACCLLKHEMVHCDQFVLSGKDGAPSNEREGYEREIKCLEAVLVGKSCKDA